MDIYKIPIGAALGFVVFVLIASIIASKIWPQEETKETETTETKEAEQNV
jgi:hypothetical protein